MIIKTSVFQHFFTDSPNSFCKISHKLSWKFWFPCAFSWLSLINQSVLRNENLSVLKRVFTYSVRFLSFGIVILVTYKVAPLKLNSASNLKFVTWSSPFTIKASQLITEEVKINWTGVLALKSCSKSTFCSITSWGFSTKTSSFSAIPLNKPFLSPFSICKSLVNSWFFCSVDTFAWSSLK